MPLITALSAIIGVISGGIITYWSNSKLKSIEIRHKIETESITEKKAAYTEFLCLINESATKMIQEKRVNFDLIHPLSASLAKIEILASENVFDTARDLFGVVLSIGEQEVSASELAVKRVEFVNAVKKELHINT